MSSGLKCADVLEMESNLAAAEELMGFYEVIFSLNGLTHTASRLLWVLGVKGFSPSRRQNAFRHAF